MLPTEPFADSPTLRKSKLKLPQDLKNGVHAFPPNRNTMGGTAYLIVSSQGNVLVDCPPWREGYADFLGDRGGVRWLILTHRGNISSDIARIQSELGCEIFIQEQEAYLLPSLAVTSFEREKSITKSLTLIWTPGHSPGSTCLHDARFGGRLWTGRHLLPDLQGSPVPLRTAKTFHWRRQLQSVRALRDRFSPETLANIYPGANLGLLRGKKIIENAYHGLQSLELNELG